MRSRSDAGHLSAAVTSTSLVPSVNVGVLATSSAALAGSLRASRRVMLRSLEVSSKTRRRSFATARLTFGRSLPQMR